MATVESSNKKYTAIIVYKRELNLLNIKFDLIILNQKNDIVFRNTVLRGKDEVEDFGIEYKNVSFYESTFVLTPRKIERSDRQYEGPVRFGFQDHGE